MKLSRKLQLYFSSLAVVVLLSACSDSKNQSQQSKVAMPKMDALVNATWLNEHLNDPNLVILDSTVYVKMTKTGQMTNESGLAGYQKGHIPNAVFADLKGNLSDTSSSFDFVMPSPEQFSAAMGALGVDNDSRVVIYSADNHVWGTRLWWMLRWAGHDNVAILDGGLAGWKEQGLPVSTKLSTPTAKKFVFNLRPEVIAEQKEVLAAVSNKNVRIVDAMPAAHYLGKFSLYSRPGHIVSASSMPTSDLLDESGNFKSFDELDMTQEGDRSQRVITYCGGGVAASSVAFTMVRLGYTDVAVYMGSLQEWSTNPDNPMTTDAL